MDGPLLTKLNTSKVEREPILDLGRVRPLGPKLLLTVFYLLLLFEGAIRKWYSPELAVPLQVLRDILPGAALLLYLLSRPARRDIYLMLPNDATLISFMAYGACATLSIAMSSGSLVVPLIGLRTHFAYVPLAPLLGALMDGSSALRRAVRAGAVIAAPICILAVIQTTQPASSKINIYASGDEAGAFFGSRGLVRASGTFSYITGMGVLAQFLTMWCLYLLVTASTKKDRYLMMGIMAVSVMACFASGARGVVFGVLAGAAIMAVVCPSLVTRGSHLVLRHGFAAIIVAIAIAYFAVPQMEAFAERSSDAGDVTPRLNLALFEWVDVVRDHPLGTGLGTGHQQAATFVGGFGGFEDLPEAELSRVALELGIVGFVSFLVFRFLCMNFGYGVARASASFDSRVAGAVAVASLVLLFIGGIYTPVANAVYWSSLGVVLVTRNERSAKIRPWISNR